MNNDHNEGFDLTGIGKIAKAIPKEVYLRTTKTLLTTFENLVAPITETSSGFGRYIRQKFDNMVEVEKAIATYTLEKVIARAKAKVALSGARLKPVHSKSFVRALEEASKETDPLLHEMWTNLLTTQIVDGKSHPHFVETLTHFSPAEAKILISLNLESNVGDNNGPYFYANPDSFKFWVKMAGDPKRQSWSDSCSLLCGFGFAYVLSLPEGNEERDVVILCRTTLGEAFLKTVSP
jgi:hypothetical protein